MKRGKGLILATGLILILICFSGAAAARDGALDLSFDPGLGVQKISMLRGQADWTTSGSVNGYSLVFGYFTSINGNAINSIARLTDFNGTVDTGFSFPINGLDGTGVGEVRGAYLADPTDLHCDIIIWGSFSLNSGGTTYYNLARLKWNTSAYVVDTGFPVVFNPSGLVSSVAVIGSFVLVGGYNLQPVGGAANTAYHLVRLDSGFHYDSSYNSVNAYTQAKSLPGGYVTAIGLYHVNPGDPWQPRIFGTLPVSDGSGHWNGTYHWWEAFGSDTITFQKSLGNNSNSPSTNNYGPIDGPIFALAQTPTSQYIIVGAFNNVFGYALKHVAQLNNLLTDRDDAYSFNTNIHNGGGADHLVQQIMISNGQPILAGGLIGFNGTPCGHIVRLNYSGTIGGTVDTGFNSGGTGFDDRVFRLYQPAGLSSYLQIVGGLPDLQRQS